MQAYLKRDIAGILGKSPKVIQTWTDSGLVNPDLVPSQGRGIARVYSPLNLLQFAFCDELLKCRGMNLSTIKWIMNELRSKTTDEISFKLAIKRNQDGNLLFTGDFDHPSSFSMARVSGYEAPLLHSNISPAYFTVNLSQIIENAESRV